MSINTNFAGKRILITGGGNGLGRALVKKFHEGNALVFTVDRDEEALKKLKIEFPNVTYAVVDLSDWEATRKTVESFGPMDHLVNNAGVLIPETFLEITKDSLEKQMNVNYISMVNVSQAVVKGMIQSKTGGSIVNLSSISNKLSFERVGAYSATKAAVTMLTKSMALELGVHNIRVNCVCPGPMDTEMMAGAKFSQATLDSVLGRAVFRRLIEPSEAVDLICFLLSSLAGMITGSAVVIDGGYSTT